MEKLRFQNDYVLVRPWRVKEELTSKGGIIIPESVKERQSRNYPARGTVLAVGPGEPIKSLPTVPDPKNASRMISQRVPMTVKPEEVILYTPHAGFDIEIDGQTCRMIQAPHVICVVDEPDEYSDMFTPPDAPEAAPEKPADPTIARRRRRSATSA